MKRYAPHMDTLTYDTSLEPAIDLIGKRNVAVSAATGQRVSGSRVTHEWCRRCDKLQVPDLIVDPRARGGVEIRLDLAQAGMKLRQEDVDQLNTEFMPIAKGKRLFVPFTPVYSNIKVDVAHASHVVTQLQAALTRATRPGAQSSQAEVGAAQDTGPSAVFLGKATRGKSVARAIQNMVKRELGIEVSYAHCLGLARKYDKDPKRPAGVEASAAYIFDREYP